MLKDKIRELYADVKKAELNAAAWKQEARERMRKVRKLCATEKATFDADFDASAFLAECDGVTPDPCDPAEDSRTTEDAETARAED